MGEIIKLDMTGKSYEEVDQQLRRLCGFSENDEWTSLKERAFYGIIPQKNTKAFYDIVAANWKENNKEYTEQSVHKYFRIDTHLSNFFITNELIYTYVIKKRRVFVTCVYEEYEHKRNINLFKQLDTIMKVANTALFSIKKDIHDGPRNRGQPFMRSFVALLVIDLF